MNLQNIFLYICSLSQCKIVKLRSLAKTVFYRRFSCCKLIFWSGTIQMLSVFKGIKSSCQTVQLFPHPFSVVLDTIPPISRWNEVKVSRKLMRSTAICEMLSRCYIAGQVLPENSQKMATNNLQMDLARCNATMKRYSRCATACHPQLLLERKLHHGVDF